MTREEFLNNFWAYYCILENDFVFLRRYIDLSEENYNTYSQEINKQLLSVCAEFENICKHIAEIKKGNIREFSKWVSDIDGGVNSVKIIVKHSRASIILEPFKTWDSSGYGKSEWWQAYNKLKHNKIENYSQGNLKNLITSLAALYFVEMYYIKKIDTEYGVPNDISKVFKMDDWETPVKVFAYDSYISNRKKTT